MKNKLDTCLEKVDKTHFFIQDGKNQTPAFIVEGNGEFEVLNTTNESIYFLKIDSCLYHSNDTTRCDCAIYNNNVFCFIELKKSKRTNWKSHRKTAENQLKTTILDFTKEEIIKEKNLEAYMCCTYCDIHDKITKISKATNKYETITYFEDELNTALYCDTKKEFN